MFVYLACASCSNGTLQTQRKPYINIIHAFIQRSLLSNPTNNDGWVAIWGQKTPIVRCVRVLARPSPMAESSALPPRFPPTCGQKIAHARACAARPAQMPAVTSQGTCACTRLPTFTSSLCRSLRALAGVRRPEQAVVGEFILGPSD